MESFFSKFFSKTIFLTVFFFFFFFFFCALAEENQEAFSEKFSFISGVLQGLVKIWKKYMEANLFLLLSCRTLIS